MLDGIFTVFLLVMAWQDLREKTVSLLLCILLAFLGLFSLSRELPGNWGLILLSVLPGSALLLFSYLTRGAVGAGDGWFLGASGLCLGPERVIQLFVFGNIICGLYCSLLWTAGKIKGRDCRKMTVPFLPFMVPAWIYMMLEEAGYIG